MPIVTLPPNPRKSPSPHPMPSTRILIGDCRSLLAEIAPGSVQTCITSPPYFGLRDYGMPGQIGLEVRLEDYVAQLVEVFRGVHRALADDGTLWLNLGDSYVARPRGSDAGWDKSRLTNPASQQKRQAASLRKDVPPREFGALKPKDLMMVPARVAMALQADGWYLRADIIWSKPNPMPESVTDRPTKAHEYLFLLTKSQRYLYDASAILEPAAPSTISRLQQANLQQQAGSARANGGTRSDRPMKAVKRRTVRHGIDTNGGGQGSGEMSYPVDVRNKRSVWTVPTQPFKDAHFATFPPGLIEPCILAGSRPGDTVLDPFGGAGTTALVAQRRGRNAILLELNPEYAAMAQRRLDAEPSVGML